MFQNTASAHYLLFAHQRGVPGEEMSACVIIRVHQHGFVGPSSLQLADETEDALVFEGRVGGTGVSALIGELHHLILIHQLPGGFSSACSGLCVLDAHTCSKYQWLYINTDLNGRSKVFMVKNI